MAGATHIKHEDHHRELVRRLSAAVTPTRRLWPIGARLAVWMALEVCLLALAMSHTSNPFVSKLVHPTYVIETAFFATAAIISATLALRSAIPGRPLSAIQVALAAGLVLSATIALTVVTPIDTATELGEFARIGRRCALETVAYGALPWLVLWCLVKRGASTSGYLSGLFVGAGSLLFSFATMRIVCPLDEPMHLLTWHLLPAIAAVVLSTLAGAAWLRLRRHRLRQSAVTD